MKVAFYKGRKRLFNKLVSWWTRGPYSHCELVFSDGQSASSSFMDGGVRYKRILYNHDHWDFIELGPEFDEQKAREWFDEHLGNGYDVAGIIGFVNPRISQDKQKEFCIEAVLSALEFTESWRYNLNTAYSALLRVQK
jgi:hypothetical protein